MIAEALKPPDGITLSSRHPASQDPKHWSVGPCICTRDSTLREQSNSDALRRHLEEDYSRLSNDWQIHSVDHWGCGWVEHLAFRAMNKDGTPSAIFRVLVAWDNALSDYPLADESDYDRRQYEAGIERINEEGRLALKDGTPEGWEEKVFSWLWDNDQQALNDVDDQGPFPTRAEVRAAMKELELLEEDEA